MPRNIYAHTAPGSDFPEYISINEKDGGVEVTVRSPKESGATAAIVLTRDQAKDMYRALLLELTPTDKA